MTTSHKNISVSDGVHIPYFKSYANASARTSDSTLASADIGKIALQSDDGSGNQTLWLLVNNVGPVWQGLTMSTTTNKIISSQIPFGTTAGTVTEGNDSRLVYVVAGYFMGTPTASDVVFVFKTDSAFTLPSGLTNSQFDAETRPSVATTFTIAKHNGTSYSDIGSFTINTGTTAPSVSFTSNVSFSAGNKLKITAPSSLNSLAGLSFTLRTTA